MARVTNGAPPPATLLGGQALVALALPLIKWYAEHARPLPWREDPTPYHVWLSEIMLQQTRIEAVRPYYARFLEAAPTLADLAGLPDEKLMKLWEGLGYYSRARNLKRAAREAVERHGGELPADLDALRALSGIGPYTAGAIASIAFGLPVPAVDGNVLRVLARLTADRADVLSPKTVSRMTAALGEVYRTLPPAEQVFHNTRPPAFGAKSPAACLTQGLMELGQTVCVPNRTPACSACPLRPLCKTAESGDFEGIPYRAPKKPRRTEHKLVLLLRDAEGHFAIRRRPHTGLLADLYELPTLPLSELEAADPDTLDRFARAFCEENGCLPAEAMSLPPARHIFTHLEWHMSAVFYNVEAAPDTPLLFATPDALRTVYALPSAFSAYLPFILSADGAENDMTP